MCVLCDRENLKLLVRPLEELGHRQLADAIGIAREAAWQLVLDTADAIPESDQPGAPGRVRPDGYVDYVIDRARRDGVLDESQLAAWSAEVHDGGIYLDPRVQAFLSSAVEGLAAYILQIQEHKNALELFLEERGGAVVFAGVGMNGETVFDRGEERYVVLTDDEAMRIAIDHLATDLASVPPEHLIEYTNLPPGATDVVVAMQQGAPDRANEILAGIVDLQALAHDSVRQTGYGPFVARGVTDEYSEQRFGDRIIIRLRLPGGSAPE